MSDKKTGGPAFPCEGGQRVTVGNDLRKTLPSQGMSMRDYFAANAPITMTDAELAIKAIGERSYNGEQVMKMLCELRWFYADSMLESRND